MYQLEQCPFKTLLLGGWVENAAFQKRKPVVSKKHTKLENEAPQTQNNLFRHASAFSLQNHEYRKVPKVTTLVTFGISSLWARFFREIVTFREQKLIFTTA